ncbi:hypothetical protein IIA79_05225 [bacterium]|nr:hypothetical protein [bacterium]
MRRLGCLSFGYRYAWAVLVVLFGLSVWWVLFKMETGPVFSDVDPSEVKKSTRSSESQEAQAIAERVEPLNMELSKAEFSLSSADGFLIMRVWADKAVKEGGHYTIDQGVMQFALEDRNRLLLKVADATYRVESGVARVTGTLEGYIETGGQYFEAKEVTWDQGTKLVSATTVRYVGPHIEVTGERMSIDLATGIVTFDGPVEASI